jgi:hypothetical protein
VHVRDIQDAVAQLSALSRGMLEDGYRVKAGQSEVYAAKELAKNLP